MSEMTEQFCDCVMLLLSAGYQAEEVDIDLMNSDILRPILEPRGIQQYALITASLQHLCKLTIRKAASRGLEAHLPTMGLPPALQKYLLLE